MQVIPTDTPSAVLVHTDIFSILTIILQQKNKVHVIHSVIYITQLFQFFLAHCLVLVSQQGIGGHH